MFFKRLSILGFKSFSDRTDVELRPGVTVIVGPNGCGKSNVFDAIKWALGEQSAKSLRGGRMADVVFAGSSSRKAADVSEVTLELDNELRHLSADASTVSITRRLFRSGDSEYWLNGKPARLRDIHHLMLGTGIGANAYAIMQQGKVDRIIHARPEDRRYLIEEAAGLSKYKVQKEEALRRLVSTDEDVNRLSDLLSEVDTNAKKLREQADRAREHRSLTEELRRVDMWTIARRHEELMAAQAGTEDRARELGEQLSDFDRRIEELEGADAGRREELDELVAWLDERQATRQRLQGERHEAERQATGLRERSKALDERSARLLIETETLERGESTRGDDEQVIRTEIDALRVQIREGELDLERRQARLSGLKEGATEHDEDLVATRESIDALTEDKVSLEGEITVATQLLEKAKAAAAQDDGDHGALHQRADETVKAAETAKQSVFAAQQQHEKLQSELEKARHRQGELEAQRKEAAKRHEDAMNQLRAARSRLGALQQLQENFEGFNRGVKEVMIAAEEKKLEGIIGVVATLVRPKPGLEAAIEVALGGSLQHIVAEAAQDAKDAIEFLKKRNAGRASFLPLDIVKPYHNDNKFNALMKMPGVVGWAVDQIDFDPRLNNAILNLLGNCIVVEHLDIALAFERKGFRTKYVTLDGDILNPGGLMTGGSYKTSGLLTRETEIGGLQEQTEHLARQLVGIDETIERIEVQLGHTRQSVATLSTQSQQQQVALVSAIKDAESLDRQARELVERREQILSRRATIDDECSGYAEQIQLGGEALTDITEQLAGLKKRYAELTSSQGERAAIIDALANEVQEAKVSLATRRERLSGQDEALRRLLDDTGRQAATLAERRAERERVIAEAATCAQEIVRLESVIADLTSQLAAVEKELAARSAERQTQMEDLRGIAEQLQTLQRDRNVLQNDVQDAEIKRAQHKAQVENLAQQAAEKYETTLEDVLSSLRAELESLQSSRPAASIPSIETISSIDSLLEQPPTENEPSEELEPTSILAGMPLDQLQREANRLRRELDRLGVVNMKAIEESEQLDARLKFLTGQHRDLTGARDALLKTIHTIDMTTARLFRDCFDKVRENFIDLFRRLFGGGRADLVLTEPENLHETGIEIVAQPPGKQPQSISLLSGGEMCLTATALLFALFQWKPSPFCILDEIDAPLDDANVGRFKNMIREFADSTQFLVITHNKSTMELADTLFGVTMEEPGVSKLVSVRFHQLEEHNLLPPKSGDPVAATA